MEPASHLSGSISGPSTLPPSQIELERGSWLGPLFFWEIIREARKGRGYIPRLLYTAGLLLILYMLVGGGTITLRSASRFGDYAFYYYLMFQYLAVFILTPLYVAGTIIEERQQGTLALLLTTNLTPWELIVGKMMGRLVPILGVLLAGVPILAILQLFGGISISRLALHSILALAMVLVAGMHSIRASTLYPTPGTAIMMTYLGMIGSLFLGYLLAIPLALIFMNNWNEYGVLVSTLLFLFLQLWIGRNCVRNAVASLSYRRRGEDRSLPERAAENIRQTVITTRLEPAHTEEDNPQPITVPARDYDTPEILQLKESLASHRNSPIQWQIPPVFQNWPIIWKQLHFPNRHNINVVSIILGLFTFLFLFITANEHHREHSGARHAYHGLMRVNLILMLYISTLFAATSLVLERQQQTFFSLLAAPLSVGRITFEYVWGSIWRYRYILLMNLLLMAGCIFMQQPSCLVWYPLVFAFQLAFFSVLALLLSMLVRTTLQARLLVSLGFFVMVMVLPWALPTNTWLVKVFVMPYASWETLERLIELQPWPDWNRLWEICCSLAAVTAVLGMLLYVLIHRYLRRYG